MLKVHSMFASRIIEDRIGEALAYAENRRAARELRPSPDAHRAPQPDAVRGRTAELRIGGCLPT